MAKKNKCMGSSENIKMNDYLFCERRNFVRGYKLGNKLVHESARIMGTEH